MDDFEHDPNLPLHKAMIAGAVAGVMEHIFMYPVDTVKAMMQADAVQTRSVLQVLRTERLVRLYSGMGAVVMGAIPSHAVHFGTYELAKRMLGASDDGHHPVINALSGAMATCAHDAVVTPMDVVKQRMQVYPEQFPSISQAIGKTFRQEGLRAFYASYPVTVTMNIPFMAVYFSTYESLKVVLRGKDTKEDELGPAQHMMAGGGAGALAAMFSTPLDVIKTRLQLAGAQASATGGPAPAALSPLSVMKSIYQNDGWKGFTRGMNARVLYYTPAAAVCWTTYEAVKSLLVGDDATATPAK